MRTIFKHLFLIRSFILPISFPTREETQLRETSPYGVRREKGEEMGVLKERERIEREE